MRNSPVASYGVLGILICAGLVLAQEGARPKPADKPKPAERPAAAERGGSPAEYEKLGAPNEHHQRLQKLVGRWDLEITTPSPEGTQKSRGTAEYASILGGRFVTETVKCDLGGTPFEWFGIYGYDNAKNKYTATWVDNLGTGSDFAEGSNAGDIITLTGEMEEIPGQKTRYKWILNLSSRDHATIEMFELGKDGKATPQMSISMKKAK